MKIETQEAEYMKISLAHEGKFDEKAYESMQKLECVLPFQKIYDEDNRFVYQKGKFIPLLDYLSMKVLDFEETKWLILSFVDGFEQIQDAGGKTNNVMQDISQVYINPVTQELRFVYLPVLLELYPDNFRKMMKDLLFLLRTIDAEMVLGSTINALGAVQNSEKIYSVIQEQLQGVKSNIRVVEKKVEVDRVVEKIIEKPVKRKNNLGRSLVAYSILYVFSMIFLPIALGNFVGSNLLAQPQLLNMFFCFLAVFISIIFVVMKDKSETDDKVVVTMQPKKDSSDDKIE